MKVVALWKTKENKGRQRPEIIWAQDRFYPRLEDLFQQSCLGNKNPVVWDSLPKCARGASSRYWCVGRCHESVHRAPRPRLGWRDTCGPTPTAREAEPGRVPSKPLAVCQCTWIHKTRSKNKSSFLGVGMDLVPFFPLLSNTKLNALCILSSALLAPGHNYDTTDYKSKRLCTPSPGKNTGPRVKIPMTQRSEAFSLIFGLNALHLRSLEEKPCLPLAIQAT